MHSVTSKWKWGGIVTPGVLNYDTETYEMYPFCLALSFHLSILNHFVSSKDKTSSLIPLVLNAVICLYQSRKWDHKRCEQGEYLFSSPPISTLCCYFRDHMWWDPTHHLMRFYKCSTKSIRLTQQPGLWKWSLYSERYISLNVSTRLLRSD